MNVFCDMHHGGLYYSMHLLWEKRLEATLYTMGGMEWYKQGYWRILDNVHTASQYLECDPRAREGKNSFALNKITLDQFKAMKFDYIVASMQSHEDPFIMLRGKYQPQAKLIRQCGNAGENVGQKIPNIMNATAQKFNVPNIVTTREEFNLDDFHYAEPKNHDVITSLLHYMPSWKFYPKYVQLRKNLGGFKWKQYGVGNEQGCCAENDLSDVLRDAAFVYHCKYPADGYGHNVHHALACGRPLIINYNDYKHTISGPLLEPDVTCIDLDSVENVSRKILEYSEPKRHKEMCEAVFKRFKEVVDFDKEEQDFRKFLERCK